MLGSAGALDDVLASYAAVTPEAVCAAAARWLSPEAGATLYVVPRDGEVDDAEE